MAPVGAGLYGSYCGSFRRRRPHSRRVWRKPAATLGKLQRRAITGRAGEMGRSKEPFERWKDLAQDKQPDSGQQGQYELAGGDGGYLVERYCSGDVDIHLHAAM